MGSQISSLAIAVCVALSTSMFGQEAASLAIQIDHPIARVSPMFNGLMTEEINFSYDGGIYGELIRDRVVGPG